MAFLLLLHQKMSLQRKVNKLTLAQTSIGRRKERISKRIEKVQKAYAKKQSNIDAQAKRMSSVANNNLNFQRMKMMEGFKQVTWVDMIQHPDFADFKNDAGKKITDLSGQELQEWARTHKDDYTQIANAALAQNNQIASQRQMQEYFFSSMQSNFQDEVSIFVEVEKQRLEDEEQMALAPLEEEDTQIDLEQASNEAQLSYAQSRLDAIQQALDSRAQEAPKFGA